MPRHSCAASEGSFREHTRTLGMFAFTTVVIALALSGCLHFASVAQGVRVWPTPEDPGEAFCQTLHITAEFGIHTLIDTTFTVGDEDVFHFETPGAPTQPHYRGMLLTIDVTCSDMDRLIVGQSAYVGQLQDRRGWAVVWVYNFPLNDDCIPATHLAGTEVCVNGYGFDWD